MLKRMIWLTIVVALILTSGTCALARQRIADYSRTVDTTVSRSPVIIFFDDMESGTNGWTHVDNTASTTTKFHVDTYLAYAGSYSWWCGEFNAAFEGGDGYSNNWDQRLNVPETDVATATLPVLTYAFRHDSEPDYDFTYVQAESNGVYVNLNRGYDGSSEGWQDLGVYGFMLATYDNPIRARFRFISDGAYSDLDGSYDSDGGGFHCDNIRIFDYASGYDYFYDDCESGGLCVPDLPAAAGDWWHIADMPCAAYSDPHVWWCGDDADTSVTPSNLDNSLISPTVDVSGAVVCTLRMLIHAEVPTVDNDYWSEEVTVNGGSDWTTVGVWWGDFGQCEGWGTAGIAGIDISPFLPGSNFRFRLTFFSTDNGCGPGLAGGAGVMLDDMWIEDWTDSPIEATTWGSIKAMFGSTG